MSVVIRMARSGSRSKPFYKIVVANKAFKKEGRFIEKVGTYDPRAQKDALVLNMERIDYWLGVGAKLTRTVSSLIKRK